MANALSPAAARDDDWVRLVEDCCAPVEDCCAPDAVATATTISIASESFMFVAPFTVFIGARSQAACPESAAHPPRSAGNLLLLSGRVRDGRTQKAEAEFAARVTERDSPSG